MVERETGTDMEDVVMGRDRDIDGHEGYGKW